MRRVRRSRPATVRTTTATARSTKTARTRRSVPGNAECVMCQCALPCADEHRVQRRVSAGQGSGRERRRLLLCRRRVRAKCECQKETHKVNDEAVLCAPKSTSVAACLCKNNECTFRCAGVICQGSLVCDPTDGRCKQKSCLLPAFKCAADQRAGSRATCGSASTTPAPTRSARTTKPAATATAYTSCADVTCDARAEVRGRRLHRKSVCRRSLRHERCVQPRNRQVRDVRHLCRRRLSERPGL